MSQQVTASVLMDSHWMGVETVPHPIQELSEKHREKLDKLAAFAEASASPPVHQASEAAVCPSPASASSRVHQIVANLEATASPHSSSIAASPCTSARQQQQQAATATMRGTHFQTLGESVVLDDVPHMAPVQLSASFPDPMLQTLGNQVRVENMKVETGASTHPTEEAEDDEEARRQKQDHQEAAEAAVEGAPAASVDGGVEVKALKQEISELRQKLGSAEQQGSVLRLREQELEEARAQISSLELACIEITASRDESTQMASLNSTLEPEMSYEHEVTSLRAKLDRSNTDLEDAREQLRATLSTVASVGSPEADSQLDNSSVLINRVNLLTYALEREAKEKEAFADFADQERSVIESMEVELREALATERRRLKKAMKKIDEGKRQGAADAATERERRIDIEGMLAASERKRRELEEHLASVVTEEKFQQLKHNLAVSEAEVNRMSSANESMMADLLRFHEFFLAQKEHFLDAPGMQQLLARAEYWNQASQAMREFQSAAASSNK